MTTTYHHHAKIGTVGFTDACRELQKTNPDPTTTYVETDNGETIEVTAALLQPNPLHAGRVGCSNCRYFHAKPSKRPVPVEHLWGRCMHGGHQPRDNPERAASLQFNQHALNGNNCPCWRRISMATIAEDMMEEIETARANRQPTEP